LNERALRLQEVEGVVAVSWKSHFGRKAAERAEMMTRCRTTVARGVVTRVNWEVSSDLFDGVEGRYLPDLKGKTDMVSERRVVDGVSSSQLDRSKKRS
jgi:hypothetical protein